MKARLEKPEMEMVMFEAEDIITASGDCSGDCIIICPDHCIEVCKGICQHVTK
jgi:hypothetical protein